MISENPADIPNMRVLGRRIRSGSVNIVTNVKSMPESPCEGASIVSIDSAIKSDESVIIDISKGSSYPPTSPDELVPKAIPLCCHNTSAVAVVQIREVSFRCIVYLIGVDSRLVLIYEDEVICFVVGSMPD